MDEEIILGILDMYTQINLVRLTTAYYDFHINEKMVYNMELE